MSIILDHQMREQIPHINTAFPIAYFHDELVELPNLAGPLHWHPDFEIATAEKGTLDYQVGQQHIILKPGDSIFVNGNILHSIKQISGDVPDPMPNIVFSGTAIAPETSVIYQKYIQYIAQSNVLPFVVFRKDNSLHRRVNCLIIDIYKKFSELKNCYEMDIQRYLSEIFEYIFKNFDDLPKSETTRMQIGNQVRLQKMLSYIYEHYSESVTLEDVAQAANISRSEAGRCFNTYMGCSPIEALIQYRLQMAHKMLSENVCTIKEISTACGFNSVGYFSRQFKKNYGCSPSHNQSLGK